MASPGTDTWSFHCSACGKCCNSPPQMSVPELFHHQHRFIGCLVVRRVAMPRPGDRLGDAASGWIATEADVRAFSQLADTLLYRSPDGAGASRVLIATQAFAPEDGDASSSTACPALGDDMRCTIHEDRKPAACSVVPLDALVPDRLQHLVLGERRSEASYLGAACIVPGVRSDATRLTRRLAVVDPGYAEALARRRRDLVADKRFWGDAVFRMLGRELFDPAHSPSRIPAHGLLVMAIAPAVAVIAGASARSRERGVAYLDAQIALMGAWLRGRPDGSPGEREGSARVRAFMRTNEALRRALEHAPLRASADRGRDVEAWMGLST